jgi:hypothetical protein
LLTNPPIAIDILQWAAAAVPLHAPVNHCPPTRALEIPTAADRRRELVRVRRLTGDSGIWPR